MILVFSSIGYGRGWSSNVAYGLLVIDLLTPWLVMSRFRKENPILRFDDTDNIQHVALSNTRFAGIWSAKKAPTFVPSGLFAVVIAIMALIGTVLSIHNLLSLSKMHVPQVAYNADFGLGIFVLMIPMSLHFWSVRHHPWQLQLRDGPRFLTLHLDRNPTRSRNETKTPHASREES